MSKIKPTIHLQHLNSRTESPLFQRRKHKTKDGTDTIPDGTVHGTDTVNGNAELLDKIMGEHSTDKDNSTIMSLGMNMCSGCGNGFAEQEQILNSNGEIWHTQCFVRMQQSFPVVGHGRVPTVTITSPSAIDHNFLASSLNTNSTSGLTNHHVNSTEFDEAQVCARCGERLRSDDKMMNYKGQVWHPHCFVCAQCFQQFPEGTFYEFEGRKYCEHDFQVLFAPCCGRCAEFIIGRVIKAMNNNWHPDCFRCEICDGPLADAGFVKNAARALCRECNAREKAKGLGKYVCHKCHSIIEEGHLKFKGEAYHPYHFTCTSCSIELTSDAREKNQELYCLRCHDKMGIPICGACRRPIEERVVHALGKAWHVEHFVCARCEKPFLGTRHYEKKGLAYCELHYHQLFGNICFVCNTVIDGDVFSAFNKAWCVDHFACYICDRKMSQKTKFFEVDLKPVCKLCYEKFPGELKKRLKKAYDEQNKK